MSTKPLMILAALALGPCALAADSTKPALPKKAVPQFDLKNKSSFTLSGTVRSPFLPIGWKGAAVVQQLAPKRAVTPADAFRVSSILVGTGGNPSLAVINGRSYEEGQMIRMKTDSKSVLPQARVRLHRIGDGAVQIQLEDGNIITVPLKRGELNELQPAELLNPDR